MGGQIEKTENWGRRKLAYEIGRHKEGTYVLEVILGSGELMKEIDRRLKVLRHGDPPAHGPRGRSSRTSSSARRRGARPPRRSAAASRAGCRRIGSLARASATIRTTTATTASTWASDERAATCGGARTSPR